MEDDEDEEEWNNAMAVGLFLIVLLDNDTLVRDERPALCGRYMDRRGEATERAICAVRRAREEDVDMVVGD